MLQIGKRPCEIIKLVGREKTFINYFKNKRKSIYKCQTKKRAGAPTKLNDKAKKLIRKSRDKKGGSTRKLSKQLKQSGVANVSHETIRKFQRNEGQKPYKRKQQPLYSNKNIQRRTEFAQKYGTKSKFFWDKNGYLLMKNVLV